MSFNSLKTAAARLVADDSGATALEYALIVCLIGMAIVAGATAMGSSMNTMFSNIGKSITAFKIPTL